jgi:hypothetical protein
MKINFELWRKNSMIGNNSKRIFRIGLKVYQTSIEAKGMIQLKYKPPHKSLQNQNNTLQNIKQYKNEIT